MRAGARSLLALTLALALIPPPELLQLLTPEFSSFLDMWREADANGSALPTGTGTGTGTDTYPALTAPAQ